MGEAKRGIEQGSDPRISMAPDFLAAVFDQVGHPIFVKDRQFRFVMLNRASTELFGHPISAMLGRTDYDFFPKHEADAFRADDAEVFATGEERVIEAEPITDAAGLRHVLATTKAPLRSSTGEVTHLVGIIHDITRLKLAEEALRQSNEDLELRVGERTAALKLAQDELVRKERLALLGQLAGGLAHQLRNPLGAITNAAYLLRRAAEAHLVPGLAQPLDIIVEEAWRANRTITGLLGFLHARQPLRQPTALEPLVRRILELSPTPPGIELVVDVARELGPMMLDPDQLREALGNLVQNAIEAMPGGGTLRIRARPDRGGVVVSVSDTGGGIPPEALPTLFRPLVTTKPTGLGLGLTTAKLLVENQDGSIQFTSEPGVGTTFEIRLPCREGPA